MGLREELKILDPDSMTAALNNVLSRVENLDEIDAMTEAIERDYPALVALGEGMYREIPDKLGVGERLTVGMLAGYSIGIMVLKEFAENQLFADGDIPSELPPGI